MSLKGFLGVLEEAHDGVPLEDLVNLIELWKLPILDPSGQTVDPSTLVAALRHAQQCCLVDDMDAAWDPIAYLPEERYYRIRRDDVAKAYLARGDSEFPWARASALGGAEIVWLDARTWAGDSSFHLVSTKGEAEAETNSLGGDKPDEVNGHENAEPSTEGSETNWLLDKSLMKSAKQRLAILAAIRSKGYEPMHVPDGEKGTLRSMCEVEYPTLFNGATSFDNQWKLGIGKCWQMASHASYAKRGR